jgi:hypothetical protein
VQDTQAGLLAHMAIATKNVAPRVRLALDRILRYFKKREARLEDSCACLGTTWSANAGLTLCSRYMRSIQEELDDM